MKIQFIGAIDDVTGSMTLITTSKGNILIDAGMFQGEAEIVRRNKHELPFSPKDLHAVVLTHAHLDHSGFIPRLIKEGFRGEIFSTRETMKLAQIIMQDSAKILQVKSHPLYSFYALEDAVKAPSFFRTKKFHENFEICGCSFYFNPAGHILGAASVVMTDPHKVVFSGDLGRFNDPIIMSPDYCPETDVLVLESTYGDRLRRGIMEDDLKKFLDIVHAESKTGIIASFAVARGQLLIALISKFFQEHPEKKVRVVMDGPMMTEANKIYKQFSDKTKCPALILESLSEIENIDQEREWESLKSIDGPLIVITSSGMVSGGRIWRYLENWQHDENALLFLPGYQGAGTAGRLLSQGKRKIVSEEGVTINWHGTVITSDAFSSHADQSELLNWLKNIKKTTQIFLNHGEYESKVNLKKFLNAQGYSNVELATSTAVTI